MPALPAKPQHRPSAGAPRWPVQLAALLIVGGVVLAYANSLSAPFVFDDLTGIVKNPSIRHLWPPGEVLLGSREATGAGGRPLVNLSLALNYAVCGLDVRGYHWFNLVIHALAGLTLFGLIRRTLQRPVLSGRFGPAALPLALVTTLLWALHPLVTESVTCAIQRTESLSSLFYLLTLYAFARSSDSAAPGRWRWWSVAACLAGMATKEIVVTAPLIVLLYDRTFVGGTFREAWRQRRSYYLALGATWVLLVLLVVGNDGRGGVVGFGLGMSAWNYALTQCQAIILYLRLAFWPYPLVMDYGAEVVSGLAAVWWQAGLLVALVAATFWALARRPAVGFLAFTFFSILAPSSSFVPLTTQTIAEHRMYLPLACLVALVVLAAWRCWGRWVVPVAGLLAVVAGVATVQRNTDYRTTLSIWTDTVAHWPDNARALVNLGKVYGDAGDHATAWKWFETAHKLKPHFADASFNLANVLMYQERYAEAAKLYEQAIADNPRYAEAHYGLGYCLIRLVHPTEGLAHYERAILLQPNDVTMRHSYASSLVFVGRMEEALPQYEAALRLTPEDAALHNEFGTLLLKLNRPDLAAAEFDAAVRLAPDQVNFRFSQGMTRLRLGQYPAAAETFAAIVQAKPDFAAAHNGLAHAYLALRQWNAARQQFALAASLDPDLADAQINLERLQGQHAGPGSE